jgi:hypothetical protein
MDIPCYIQRHGSDSGLYKTVWSGESNGSACIGKLLVAHLLKYYPPFMTYENLSTSSECVANGPCFELGYSSSHSHPRPFL